MKISILLECFVAILLGGTGISQIGCTIDEITPSKALIVFTRSSWGCLGGQDVKEDVSKKVANDDDNYATIDEIKNPEDVFNRYELYLIFPARAVTQVSGSFVVKLWCDNDEPKITGSLSTDWVSLHQKGKEWVMTTKVKGTGFLHVQMLYSRSPELRRGFFSCRGEGMREPYQLTFFNAYPFEGEFGGLPRQKLSPQWQTLDLTLNPIFLEEAASVDTCQAFLDLLDKRFAVSGSPLVWELSKIETETIQTVAGQVLAGGENRFQLVLKADDGSVTNVGSGNFVPHLRQKLALRRLDGKLVGAELWLRAAF
jgi:hypothetical protein